ncbi:hypothetical protein QFZ40_002177 [Arthrobacter pascens]|nr:hypothetical protein [Arthrobacter pascens]
MPTAYGAGVRPGRRKGDAPLAQIAKDLYLD